MILGIDEVGRGPWAGPLVVGAVVLGEAEIDGLTDSKKLTKKRREELNVIILKEASGVGLGWVTAGEIDELGLAESLKLATIRAVEQIKVPYHEIILDGTINFLVDTNKGKYVTTMKQADLLVPSVSAASIVAKVARDKYMKSQDEVYPGYGFGSHAGYGTAKHRLAIEKLGVTPLHRLSFAPLAKYRRVESEPSEGTKESLNAPTRVIGDASEEVAASELARRGHQILERNWKSKYCEIDIVSIKNGVVYFTEVKHRRNAKAGDGIEAITKKKLEQMKFAAKMYVHYKKINNYDLRLLAIATSGDSPLITAYVEID